ncbi:MAG: hypothetical protein HY332_09235 [Chloroflexi bacterium]|nr:hypothetical protein [Chloroflexota bacterium]
MALRLDWSEGDIRTRAENTLPIYGLSTGRPTLTGYLHRMTCLIALGDRYAEVVFRAFLTPPNTLATPVLGRAGFFQQVDFALVEAEQRFYLRFRDRSVLHQAWTRDG